MAKIKQLTDKHGEVVYPVSKETAIYDENGVLLSNKISTFITRLVDNLANYYLKSELYTKEEIDTLIGAIQGFSYIIVSELPIASAFTMGTIYLVPSEDPQTQNIKDEYITIRSGSIGSYTYSWEQIGSTAIDLSGYVTTEALNAELAKYTTTANLTTLLAGKQDTIADLSTIRSGASAGATAYQKPGTGIPSTDMASGVQTSLGKADSAYQKPSGGIPKTDLESGVQGSLELADSAVQADPIGSIVPPVDPSEFATKEEVEGLEAEVDNFGKEISIDLTEAQDDDIEVDTNDDDYVAHIDGDGVHSKDFFVQETKTGARKSITDDLSKLDDVEKGTYYGDEEILITDDNNVVKFGVGADGPFTEGRKPLLPFDKRADGTYKEGASTDQPLASIKESMGLLPMFENWGFIGDSLSSGFINVPNVGGVSPLVDTTETIGRNIYPISWGQIICKMCGSKGANYSVGGATTRSWLSYFGGMTPANVGYSDGAKGADFSVKRDVYTIMLATNDAGQGNIPVGDISTDVDLQDYHNNADTYAGNYARIISMIKELVPSAKVFCIIPYKAWSINAEQGGYNDVVRQLVTMFDKTYLIDLYTYGGNLDTDYLYSSHSTTQGCVYTAYVIANYIDYIIRKNPQDFIFQGCVSRLANDNGNY